MIGEEELVAGFLYMGKFDRFDHAFSHLRRGIRAQFLGHELC